MTSLSSPFEFVLHTCSQGFCLCLQKPVFGLRGDDDDVGAGNSAVDPHLSPFCMFRCLYKGPHPPPLTLLIQPSTSLPSNQHFQQTNQPFRILHPKPPTKINMLSQNIFAVVALATAAVATPVIVERTYTPAQQAAQSCGNNLTLSCCNNIEKQLLGGIIPIEVGIACVAIDRESLPLRPNPAPPDITELTMQQSSLSSQSTRSAVPRLLAA